VAEADRQTWTRRWIGEARIDLQTAEACLDPQYLAPGRSCYHAQQAAEKALKAVLVFLQRDYPLTHDLGEVLRAIPSDWRIKEELPDLEELSSWAVRGRYPGDWPIPTVEQAQESFREARAIVDAVARSLVARGLPFSN
jgi:HEPN domain-containing protein